MWLAYIVMLATPDIYTTLTNFHYIDDACGSGKGL
jgi:hypothetical protein